MNDLKIFITKKLLMRISSSKKNFRCEFDHLRKSSTTSSRYRATGGGGCHFAGPLGDQAESELGQTAANVVLECIELGLRPRQLSKTDIRGSHGRSCMSSGAGSRGCWDQSTH